MASSSPERPPSRFQNGLMLLLIIAIVAGGAVFLLRRPPPVEITVLPPVPTATPGPSPTPGPIEIYVTGAVNQPQSVVTLPRGSRVQNAIDAAGGFAADADLNRVNLAEVLRDGDQVHVPSLQESGVALATPNDYDIVYINQATSEELQRLPRIGPAMAQRILDHIAQHGPFTRIEDLLDVNGIGPVTLEQMRPFISLELP